MCTQERCLTNLHRGNILSLNMSFPTERELDEEVDNVIHYFREKGKRKTNKKNRDASLGGVLKVWMI